MVTPTSDGPTTVAETFVQRWGQMAAAWGVPRVAAEIQAWLYLTNETLCADDLMERLGASRGNISLSLRTLLEWGTIRKTHRRGDRREYFQSLPDVWEIFVRVAQQRKRKEIDPVIDTLRDCLRRMDAPTDDVDLDPSRSAMARERLENMLAFLETVESLAEEFIQSQENLARVFRLLSER